jgi:DNA-directed RNA polymerase subunit K/omega
LQLAAVEGIMPDIVEELRARAQQIKYDAEVTPHGRSGEDSDLLNRAANEIENLRIEIETLRED